MEKRIKGDGGIPINYEDPKVETAVVTIQSGFRGYKDRKIVAEMRLDRSQAIKTAEENENQPVTNEVAGEGDAQENRQSEEILDIDMEDPELNKAAIKIQASFRGHAKRKEIQKSKDMNVDDAVDNIEQSGDNATDINPDHDIAATKIQSTYRGYRVRKGLGKRYDSAPEIDPIEQYQHQAAVKIQSTYRGFRTRKEFRSSSAGKALYRRRSVGDTKTTTETIDLTSADNTEAVTTSEDIQATEEVDGQGENIVTDSAGGEESALPNNDENKAAEPDSTMNETETEAEIQPEVVTESEPQLESQEESQPQSEQEPQAQSEQEPQSISEQEPQPTSEQESQQESQQEPPSESQVEAESKTEPEPEVEAKEEEVIDIDLNDPEVNKAAIKIQASFRGHTVRKNQQSSKPEEQDDQ